MRIWRHLKARLSIYQREFTLVCLVSTILFLTICFGSYNPHDSSWFYYTIVYQQVTNVCGTVGANCAAACWYLLGGAMWLLVCFLFFCGVLLIRYGSWSHCWERIVACGVMLVSCTVVCTQYGIYMLGVKTWGGAVGVYFYYMLHRWFGFVGMNVVIITIMMLSAVVAFGLSITTIKQSMQRLYALSIVAGTFTIEYSMVVIQMLWHVLVSSALSLKKSFALIKKGIFFEGTGVLIPTDQVQDAHTSAVKKEESVHGVSADAREASDNASISSKQDAAQKQHADQKVQATVADTIYELPNLSLFISHEQERTSAAVKQELEMRAYALEEKLRHFGISGSVVEIKRGPVVTVFEYLPTIDTKLSKILSLEDDLAMALQAMSIRILAPIPGTAVVGFEVANKKRHDVLFASVIKSPDFIHNTSALPLVLGKDTIGSDVIVDLVRMPHLLIAGSTGSGKSIALNTMLISLLCRRTPDEMRLILIDPKRLEFASYADIAHLLFPIVTDPRGAAPVLHWVVREMERRYEQMAVCGVRSVADYNRCTRHVQHAQPLPYIVVIIDELADLMMTAGKEVEDLITRIAQMARAAGIHMIVATQRPSVDVITGIIKVNFPSRISFRVTSKIDSRTILDCGGADKLLGRGDMLFLDATTSSLRRVHGAYITSQEIDAVVTHIRSERTVEYLDIGKEVADIDGQINPADDQLYLQVIDFLQSTDEISISLLQRKFKIGYNRSARIIELLELKGMILPADGSKTRKVIR